jgi:hypothetical protein
MSVSDIANKLINLIRPFLDLRCVGGRLYLGSMFYLDFGALFISSTSKGERIEIGEMTLSIRDVAWWLRRRGELTASAESIDADQFTVIAAQMVGTRVTDVSSAAEGSQLEVRLENDWLLVIDLTNLWDSDSDVIQVSLPDGRIIAVTEGGALDEEAGFDNERAHNWAASPRRH